VSEPILCPLRTSRYQPGCSTVAVHAWSSIRARDEVPGIGQGMIEVGVGLVPQGPQATIVGRLNVAVLASSARALCKGLANLCPAARSQRTSPGLLRHLLSATPEHTTHPRALLPQDTESMGRHRGDDGRGPRLGDLLPFPSVVGRAAATARRGPVASSPPAQPEHKAHRLRCPKGPQIA
jgi:hypothetical protein